jgi:hypothetical protein
MKTRMMRKVAVLVTGSALALSFPVASSVADQGGVPNHGKAKTEKKQKKQKKDCPSNGNGVPAGKQDPQPDKGKSCGFHKQANNNV